jgi:hypothetical protein
MPVTRTCDLYGNPYPLGELEQLGRIPIREEPVLKIALAPAYVCPGCCEKKISELLAVVKPREAEARRALRERRDERDRERRAVQGSLVFIDEERPPLHQRPRSSHWRQRLDQRDSPEWKRETHLRR